MAIQLARQGTVCDTLDVATGLVVGSRDLPGALSLTLLKDHAFAL